MRSSPPRRAPRPRATRAPRLRLRVSCSSLGSSVGLVCSNAGAVAEGAAHRGQHRGRGAQHRQGWGGGVRLEPELAGHHRHLQEPGRAVLPDLALAGEVEELLDRLLEVTRRLDFEDEVELLAAAVPPAVGDARRERDALPRAELDAAPAHLGGHPAGEDFEALLRLGVNVLERDATTGPRPPLGSDEASARLRRREQPAHALAGRGVVDDLRHRPALAIAVRVTPPAVTTSRTPPALRTARRAAPRKRSVTLAGRPGFAEKRRTASGRAAERPTAAPEAAALRAPAAYARRVPLQPAAQVTFTDAFEASGARLPRRGTRMPFPGTGFGCAGFGSTGTNRSPASRSAVTFSTSTRSNVSFPLQSSVQLFVHGSFSAQAAFWAGVCSSSWMILPWSVASFGRKNAVSNASAGSDPFQTDTRGMFARAPVHSPGNAISSNGRRIRWAPTSPPLGRVSIAERLPDRAGTVSFVAEQNPGVFTGWSPLIPWLMKSASPPPLMVPSGGDMLPSRPPMLSNVTRGKTTRQLKLALTDSSCPSGSPGGRESS